MKKCKFCQSEIDEKATVCPQCRRLVKFPIGTWIGVTLFILAIAFGLALLLSINDEDTTEKSNNSSNNSNYNETQTASKKYNGYEEIYIEYSERLKNECPMLSIRECAEVSNEGVQKMAEYMYSASGTEGQYQTYKDWANKLTQVYLQEAK